jgi:DNA adenine methylase
MKNCSAENLEAVVLNDSAKIRCRPFLKWVGGKSQLLPELRRRLPRQFGRYFEPFIGGGALFFNLQPRRAYISDINPELINAYQVVQHSVEELISDLSQHVYEKEYFYRVRALDHSADFLESSKVARASRLIFLNKTCFNGLYRVNSKGLFNTPFGKYTNPTILDSDNLRACSAALADIDIQQAPFDALEALVGKNDFVYFDPPYVPLSVTANYTGYTRDGFDLDMQRRLYELCCRLDARGAYFMLSNSSAPFVVQLYQRFNLEFVDAARAINSKGSKRGPVAEVMVTNYR